MHKTSLPLIPITLLLSVSCAWGQAVSLDHQPMTPTQAALSDLVLTELLAATGGEEGLFRAVTGANRQPTQKLFLSVPDAALQLGTITYERNPEFVLASLWDQAAMCQQASPVSAPAAAGDHTKSKRTQGDTDATGTPQTMQLASAKVVSTKTVSIPNTGQWSAVRAHDRAPDWFIEVTPNLGTSGTEAVQRFSFLPKDAVPGATPDTVLKFSTPLTADYGTRVVYRQQAVLMRATKLPFTASAQVTSLVPLNFNVRTVGAAAGFYFNAGEKRVMQLVNLPAKGAVSPAQDAHLGTRVLQSPNGAYVLGREVSTGAYSLVDAMRSVHPATGAASLQRVWTTLTKGNCADSDLVLNTAGDLVFLCNGTGKLVYQNTGGSKPCQLLTLSNAGELICRSDRIDGEVVFQTKAPAASTKADTLVTTQQAYQKTWQQLTGTATKTFSFTGQYTGDRVISPVMQCTDSVETLPVKPAACAQAVAKTRADQYCPATRTTLARLRGNTQDTASSQP